MISAVSANTITGKDKNIFRHLHLPHPSLKVSVVLPAKNEESSIVHALEALKNQVQTNGSKLDYSNYEVLLLANNCTDSTLNLARSFAICNPAFSLHIVSVELSPLHANIGYVRRLLMDEAYRRLCYHGLRNGIIASTDSDTIVDTYWVNNIIHEISLGCDAVGGRILTNTMNHKTRLYYLRDVTYRLLIAKTASIIDPDKNNPWPCHHQYFGASLALTCSIYHHCGRLPLVPYLEDLELFKRLVKVDAKIRCSPQVKVFTSSRTKGRVEIGFSEQLHQWTINQSNEAPQIVESAKAILLTLQCKKMLRECYIIYFNTGVPEIDRIKKIADGLYIDSNWLLNELTHSDYFGELWQKTEAVAAAGIFFEKYSPSQITTAIRELRTFLRKH